MRLPTRAYADSHSGTLTEFRWKTKTPVFQHYRQSGGKMSVALAKDVKKFFRLALLIVAAYYFRKLGYKRIRNEAIVRAAMGYQRVLELIGR